MWQNALISKLHAEIYVTVVGRPEDVSFDFMHISFIV